MSSTDLVINVTSKMVGGQIYFDTTFNRALTSNEAACMKSATVNLSRGGNKPYPLNSLSAHNGGGANWNDGQSIHTSQRQSAYRQRVMADIGTTWTAFKAAVAKANTPVVANPDTASQVFFSANGQ